MSEFFCIFVSLFLQYYAGLFSPYARTHVCKQYYIVFR